MGERAEFQQIVLYKPPTDIENSQEGRHSGHFRSNGKQIYGAKSKALRQAPQL